MPYAQMNPTGPDDWALTVHDDDDGDVIDHLATLTISLERGETFATAEPVLDGKGWQSPYGWYHWVEKGSAYTAAVVER